MAFFGLSYYGVSDPIKFAMRPDYQEPENPPDMTKFAETCDLFALKRPFSEMVKHLDAYIGPFDGYAYRSCDQLQRMRKRGFLKPVGPSDTYLLPTTEMMKCGWFLTDDALKNETWHVTKRYPMYWSESTKYVNRALMTDKLFRS